VVSLAERDPRELAESLAAQGVAGAIIDCDDYAVAGALIDAGIPTVQVDAVHPRAPSVLQDNFTAAFTAVEHLAARGSKRIAFLGCDFAPNPNLVHLHERLGGYLVALRHHRLEIRTEWQLVGPPGPEPVGRLVDLARGSDAPQAAAVLWPELLEPLGEALSSGALKLPVVTWWGCTPERRDAWRARAPGIPLPPGISWSAQDMARAAFARLDELTSGRTPSAGRTLVPVRLVPGEEK
jgi:DNA-binding LacI/PurR family transcriptional regulator